MTRSLALATLVILLAEGASAQCSVQIFERSIPVAGDRYGAALATDGGFLVVGIPGLDDPLQLDGGGAEVWRRNPLMEWELEQAIPAIPAPGVTGLGESVAISGGYLALGAPNATSNGGTGFVAVYEYHIPSGAWLMVTGLTPSVGNANGRFGTALCFDGDDLLVGAPTTGTGTVFQFRRDASGQWLEVDSFTTPEIDHLGTSIDVDGDTLVVGAPHESLLVAGGQGEIPAVGTVYVYGRSGASWSVVRKVEPGLVLGLQRFGESVAVSGDRMMVGAPFGQGGQFNVTGAVHVLERGGTGEWVETQRLLAQVDQQQFGRSVDLHGDLALVGAPHFSFTPINQMPGRAYVYQAGPGTPATWKRLRALASPAGQPNDRYGYSVVLDDDPTTGALAIVSVPEQDLVGEIDAGQVFYEGTMLRGCPRAITAASGGDQLLRIRAGADHAGDEYFVLGSASGTAPGFGAAGIVVPLVFDKYTLITIKALGPNPPAVTSAFHGVLNAQGRATATLTIPADPSLAGLTLFHAVVFAPPGGTLSTLGTHAVPLTIE